MFASLFVRTGQTVSVVSQTSFQQTNLFEGQLLLMRTGTVMVKRFLCGYTSTDFLYIWKCSIHVLRTILGTVHYSIQVRGRVQCTSDIYLRSSFVGDDSLITSNLREAVSLF